MPRAHHTTPHDHVARASPHGGHRHHCAWMLARGRSPSTGHLTSKRRQACSTPSHHSQNLEAVRTPNSPQRTSNSAGAEQQSGRQADRARGRGRHLLVGDVEAGRGAPSRATHQRRRRVRRVHPRRRGPPRLAPQRHRRERQAPRQQRLRGLRCTQLGA